MSTSLNNRTRILVVAKWFPPASHGKAARAMQMAKVASAMHAAGLQIEVVAGVSRDVADRPQWPFPVHYVPYREELRRNGLVGRMFSQVHRIGGWSINGDWVGRAAATALLSTRSGGVDVILTASNPGESHLVGLRLKKETALPWIAFFSDPWPFVTLPAPYRPDISFLRRKIQSVQGSQILSLCDAVAMPTIYGIEQVESELGVALSHKGCAVGHVGADALGIKNENAHVQRRLVHIGDLTHRFSPALIEAVVTVAREAPEYFEGLLCVGNFNHEYESAARDAGVKDILRFSGPIPGPEAALLAASAKALLVIEAEMTKSPFLPSKFADYARARRPILAVTPSRSAMRDYLNQHGGGMAVGHSAEEIAAALRTLFVPGKQSARVSEMKSATLASCFSPETVVAGYAMMFEKVRRGSSAAM